MKAHIVAMGSKMPSWIEEGFKEYYQRLSTQWSIKTHWIPLNKRSKTSNLDKILSQESHKMLQAIPDKAYVIALDQGGQSWSTEKLAQNCSQWQQLGQPICFMIGGPEGLAQTCLKHADEHWSLSKLTLPHPMVRVILMEQLYRAWSLLNNHPYHK